MKKRLFDRLVSGRRFREEFRRQVRMLIIITFGFTIAFTWRQTIFDLSQTLVQFITNIKDSSISSILTSLFITFISLFIIYFTAHLLKERLQ